jgi:HEPN domain-containing protein
MVKQTNTHKEWRRLAERDFAVAEYLAANMHPVPAEIVAYHCQQTAEKYLKGALVVLGITPPYTHDLDELCSLAETSRPAFSAISSQCTTITQFAVQPRYDLGLSLSETDMRLVLQYTRRIKDFLQNEINELFQE